MLVRVTTVGVMMRVGTSVPVRVSIRVKITGLL